MAGDAHGDDLGKRCFTASTPRSPIDAGQAIEHCHAPHQMKQGCSRLEQNMLGSIAVHRSTQEIDTRGAVQVLNFAAPAGFESICVCGLCRVVPRNHGWLAAGQADLRLGFKHQLQA